MEDRFRLMMRWLPFEWVTSEVIDLLFGIRQEDELLWGSFRAWATRLRRSREVLRPGMVNRHAFESYLQHAQLLSVRQAGARLGMSESSFVDLLTALEERGLSSMSIGHSPQVVSEGLVRGVHDLFPALHHRIFSNHDDYCTRLHAEIKQTLSLDIEAVFCETSVALGKEPPDHAHDYDCLTGAPIGLRYQVWLDFKKPINLRPDVCSLKLYAEQEDLLRDRVMSGSVPEIPDALRPRK